MMPDITMCSGEGCPAKEKCYRFTAEPSYRQSYFLNPPIKDGKCDHYCGEQDIWNQLNDIIKE